MELILRGAHSDPGHASSKLPEERAGQSERQQHKNGLGLHENQHKENKHGRKEGIVHLQESTKQNERFKTLICQSKLKMRNWKIVRFAQKIALATSRIAGVTVVRFFFWCCTVFVIIWIAVLMYASFYYAYMPTVSHVRPVFLLFK